MAQAVFQGLDSAGHEGLWVTDGTQAGTSELTPITGANAGGLAPANMALVNGEVLFNGNDTGGLQGLWVTDGTVAGTSELTPISGANTSPAPAYGFTPIYFAEYNGKALFSGMNAAGHIGLWVTDGSAAGTSELTPITNAATNGLFFSAPVITTSVNPYFTLLNGKVLFSGFDNTQPSTNLWVTDGSAAGTSELTGISGANFQGLFPSGLTLFNNKVLFQADDAGNNLGLWVSDGTVGGTSELTGISGAAANGVHPFDLTVFNNEVLFSGQNNSGNQNGLWVTDGTALNTHEVTGIVGANSAGILTVPNADLTVFNGKVLFEGKNNAAGGGNFGLWVTDGTGLGTSELSIATANPLGIFLNVNNPNFTVLNGKVLFEGNNAAGHLGLWVTDGTAGGTSEITPATGVASAGFDPSHLLFLTDLPVPGPALTNVSNINYTEEGAAVTLAGSASVTDSTSASLVSATVAITGGAFANDSDLLTAVTTGTSVGASYNSTTETLTLSGIDTLINYQHVLDSITFSAAENPTNFGSNPTRTVTWTLNDGSATSTPVTSTISVTNINDPPSLSNVASSVQVQGTQTVVLSPAVVVSDADNLNLASATVKITGGTFAGDGDVLSATGNGTILANYNPATETLTLTGSDTLAHYQAVLDSVTFNSTNPNPTNSGANPTRTVTWTLDDGSASTNLSTAVTTTIAFQGGALPYDLNGDVNSDLVFQNGGQPGIWLMNGPTPIAETTLSNPGASWHVITSRDVNGDGKADLIWQNSDGTPGVWLMNGTSPIAEVGLTNPGPTWHLVTAGDVNGDGNADLIWRDTGGTLGVWEMNGTTPIAEASLGNPGSTWKVIGAADFNGDRRDDILLQNSVTGNLMIDLMNGTSVASSVSVTVGDPSWHAVSTGEFNGQAAIAWQQNGGTVGLWLMNGTAPVAEMGLTNPGPGWQLISVDHFTQNGQPDLLFQNTNGAMMLWEMNGTSIAAQINLQNPTAAWQSVNGHPFASG